MKKRILALFLACMMIVSVIAVPAFAETDPCAEGHDKTYVSIQEGKDVPTDCTETTVCYWTCKNCDETGYEKVTGAHDLETVFVDATCEEASKAGKKCANCDYEEAMTYIGEKLGHDWKIDTSAEDYEAPSCTEDGTYSFYCTRCGKTKVDEVKASDHAWDVIGYVDPTCDKASGIKYECLLCGETKVEEFDVDDEAYEAPTKHKEVTKDKDATCSEDGYEGAVVCEVCGKVITPGKVIEASAEKHVGKLVETLKAPDCTKKSNGVGRYECELCEADMGYMVIEYDHDWTVSSVVAPTCGKNGKIVYVCSKGCKKADNKTLETKEETLKATDVAHTWVKGIIEATCTEPEYVGTHCSVCGVWYYDDDGATDVKQVEKSEPLGHNMVKKIDGIVDKDGKAAGVLPTCGKGGKVGLFYEECSRCGLKNGDKDHPISLESAPAHNLPTTGGTYAEPDCVNPSGMKFVCKSCGETVRKNFKEGDAVYVKPTGHDYPAAKNIGATCAAAGYEGYQKCKTCGHETWTKKITDWTKHGNKYLIDTLKPATCTTNGVGMYGCKTKGCEKYVAYEVIEADCTWVLVDSKAATCSAKGYKKYVCAIEDCGGKATKTDDIAQLSHSWTTLKTKAYIAPDCENGSRLAAKQCSKCKEYSVFEAAPDKLKALGHVKKYNIDCVADDDDKDGKIDGFVPAYPTCTATGWGYTTCNRCGVALDAGTKNNPVEIPMIDHIYGNSVYVDATCDHANGFAKTCQVCEYVHITEMSEDEDAYEPQKEHTPKEATSLTGTCMYRGYTDCVRCADCNEVLSINYTGRDYNNHVYVLVSVLKEATCTTPGVGQFACKNPDCADVTAFKAIAPSHSWNEKDLVVSESGNAIYYPCTECDAVKVLEYLGGDEEYEGKVIDSLTLDATVVIDSVVNKGITLVVKVSDVADCSDLWIEVNGKKVTDYNEVAGVYTFVYKVATNTLDETFNVVVKGEIYGVVCTAEASSYEFALLDAELDVERHATTKIENATATFTGRGVLIGETVKLLYHVTAPEAASVVLKKFGTDTVFATVDLSKLTAVDGVYVVEIEVNAEDWDQVFSATVVDAEGEAISNTNHYSVAQYAANNIKGNDTLSVVLSAMMQAIAD